jgi:hypothetical protein
VPMATKAIQRKALKESLVACSAQLKKQIKRRKILKRKNPIGLWIWEGSPELSASPTRTARWSRWSLHPPSHHERTPDCRLQAPSTQPC